MATRFTALSLAITTVISLSVSASAQNTAVGPLDLIVTFQNPGGNQGATAILLGVAGTTGTTGSARTNILRDLSTTAPGSFVTLNNIGSNLTSAYGSTWYDQPTLFMAGIVNVGTSSSSTSLTSGDAQRTVYFTRARNTIGTVGQPDSTGFTNANSSFYDSAAGGINTLKNNLEQIPSASANVTPVLQYTTAQSSLDEAMGFITGTTQDAAFGVITGGIQGAFAPGTFGSFGSAGSVELALDLYRMQPGQLGDLSPNPNVTGPTGVSIFLGTLTIDQTGQLGFTAAIPEPSTTLLFGGMATFLAGTFRRRKVAA